MADRNALTREVEAPIPASTSSIGIDVGIARFATMSDERFDALQG